MSPVCPHCAQQRLCQLRGNKNTVHLFSHVHRSVHVPSYTDILIPGVFFHLSAAVPLITQVSHSKLSMTFHICSAGATIHSTLSEWQKFCPLGKLFPAVVFFTPNSSTVLACIHPLNQLVHKPNLTFILHYIFLLKPNRNLPTPLTFNDITSGMSNGGDSGQWCGWPGGLDSLVLLNCKFLLANALNIIPS